MDHPDDAGQTLELALGELYGRLPLGLDADLREQLPGLEPERRVTDWGRSERVEGVVDHTLYEFLYRYWFRVEVRGDRERARRRRGAARRQSRPGRCPPTG